jgi:DNA-binding MarR family transcriptional regulator
MKRSGAATGRSAARGSAGSPRELAVALHDIAWLLPRTIGAPAMRAEPQAPTALEVMRLLTRRPGLSVNEVARELGVAANNVSTAVSTLEEQGTLARFRDEHDGRIVRLYPTDVAQAARRRRERSWGRSMASSLGALDPTDSAALLAATPALRRLIAHLAADDGRSAPG